MVALEDQVGDLEGPWGLLLGVLGGLGGSIRKISKKGSFAGDFLYYFGVSFGAQSRPQSDPEINLKSYCFLDSFWCHFRLKIVPKSIIINNYQ